MCGLSVGIVVPGEHLVLLMLAARHMCWLYAYVVVHMHLVL